MPADSGGVLNGGLVVVNAELDAVVVVAGNLNGERSGGVGAVGSGGLIEEVVGTAARGIKRPRCGCSRDVEAIGDDVAAVAVDVVVVGAPPTARSELAL